VKNLVGRRVYRVFADSTQIDFEMADGSRLGFAAEGDCCSRSWIEHVSNVEQVLDAVVLRIEYIDLPDAVPSPPEDVEVEVIYGTKIHTDKGYLLIEYRNNSNGYYGGYLCGAGPNYSLPELKEDL
jgi:hypothetical protein